MLRFAFFFSFASFFLCLNISLCSDYFGAPQPPPYLTLSLHPSHSPSANANRAYEHDDSIRPDGRSRRRPPCSPGNH